MVVVRPYDERATGEIYNASLLLGGDGLDDVALDDRRLFGAWGHLRVRRRGPLLVSFLETVTARAEEAAATCAESPRIRHRDDAAVMACLRAIEESSEESTKISVERLGRRLDLERR